MNNINPLSPLLAPTSLVNEGQINLASLAASSSSAPLTPDRDLAIDSVKTERQNKLREHFENNKYDLFFNLKPTHEEIQRYATNGALFTKLAQFVICAGDPTYIRDFCLWGKKLYPSDKRLHIILNKYLEKCDQESGIQPEKREPKDELGQRVEKMLSKFDFGGKLISAGITEATIKETIKNALQKKEETKFWLDEEGNQTYVVKKLNKGYFSSVYLFIDLKNSFAGVLKRAKKKVPGSQLDVERSFDVLTRIHSKGNVWGIQRAPHRCVQLKVKNPENQQIKEKFGVLENLYTGGNLLEYVRRQSCSLRESFLQMHQLLSALKFLEETKILHGDIKILNILMDGTRVHLADFGGAIDENISHEDIEKILSGETLRGIDPTNIHAVDGEIYYEFKRSMDYSHFIEFERKRDIFALGVTLYCALDPGQRKPYQLIGNFLVGDYIELRRKDIPNEILELIRRMCAINYRARPSASEVFELFDRYLKEQMPDIHAEILRLSQLER